MASNNDNKQGEITQLEKRSALGVAAACAKRRLEIFDEARRLAGRSRFA